MNRWLSWTLAGALTVAGCSTARTPGGASTTPAPPEPVPPPTTTMVPKGTELRVQLNDTLSSERSKVGDRFTVTVPDTLFTPSHQVVIPAGATITGLVTGVNDSDHAGDQAYIRLNLVRLTMGKANFPFAAEIVGTQLTTQQTGDDLKDTAINAGAGVLGAIMSGDLKTAAEAAQLGAGAGTIISLGATGREEVLPAGTTFRIRTAASVSLER